MVDCYVHHTLKHPKTSCVIHISLHFRALHEVSSGHQTGTRRGSLVGNQAAKNKCVYSSARLGCTKASQTCILVLPVIAQRINAIARSIICVTVHSDCMGCGTQYKGYQTNHENNDTNAKNLSDPDDTNVRSFVRTGERHDQSCVCREFDHSPKMQHQAP